MECTVYSENLYCTSIINDILIIRTRICSKYFRVFRVVNLRFHGIYWPAFLMAADLEPPRSLFCHSHWTVDTEKMSKSKNNVVCPINRSEMYTTEGLRYFLLREGVAHSDGSKSFRSVV